MITSEMGLEDWLKHRIESYGDPKVQFESANIDPAIAYELGRYDGLLEIKYFLENGKKQSAVMARLRFDHEQSN